MYTTITVNKDKTHTEDKGVYLDGLSHAKECCEKRLLNEPNINFIILCGIDANPISIKRQN